MSDAAIAELAPKIGVRNACDAVGVAQAGYYRRHRSSPPPARSVPRPHKDRPQPRALSESERAAILDELHSERFVDMSPTEVWATLLDEGRYRGSISTFYRLLRQAGESRERRASGHPPSRLETGTGCLPAQFRMVMGYHEAARPGQVELVLPVCDLGHLLPLRRWVDGRYP